MKISFWDGKFFKFFLILTVIFLIIIDYHQLSIFPVGKVDYNALGSLANWFAGLITAIAALIAAEALKLTHREANRQNLEKEAQKRNEEGKVYAWLEYEKDEVRNQIIGVKVVFLNYTDTPIYDWQMNFESMSFSVNNEELEPIMPQKSVKKLPPILSNSIRSLNKLPRTELIFTSIKGEKLTRDFYGNLMLLK